MRFSRKYLGIPYYIFLGLFVIAPLVVLFTMRSRMAPDSSR